MRTWAAPPSHSSIWLARSLAIPKRSGNAAGPRWTWTSRGMTFVTAAGTGVTEVAVGVVVAVGAGARGVWRLASRPGLSAPGQEHQNDQRGRPADQAPSPLAAPPRDRFRSWCAAVAS